MTRHVFMYLQMSRHIFVIPIVLSMAPLHSLSHNDQNKVKHDVFSTVIPFVPEVPCDAN